MLGGETGSWATEPALEAIEPDGWVVVLDREPTALEELRRAVRRAGIVYLLGEASILPLPDRSADAVLAEQAVDGTAAGEFFRVLRPAGRVSLLERGEHSGPALEEAGFGEVEYAAVDGGFVVLTERR